MWESIPLAKQRHYCGVVGLCLDSAGKIVGDEFPSDPPDATSVELWFDYGVRGEKFAALSVEALKSCPFPEDIPDLVPESVVWFRLSRQYRVRCFNVPVRIYHRDVESMTLPSDPPNARPRRAEGALLSYAEALDWITWARILRSPIRCVFLAVQYWRWWLYLPWQRRRFYPGRAWIRLVTAFFFPLGWGL